MQRKKRRIKVSFLFVCFIMIIVLLGGMLLLYRYLPSNKWMSLDEYYVTAQEGKPAILLNDVIQAENAWVEDGVCYLPAAWVNSQLDSRFYTDGKNVILTNAEHLWIYYPEDTSYLLDGQEQTDEEVKVILRENELYLRMDWVADETGVVYNRFENPERIWLWNQFDIEISCAKTKESVKVRYRGGVKSPILEELNADERVFVRGEIGKWTNVQTQSGIIGYVKTKELGEIYSTWMEQKSGKQEYSSQNLGKCVNLVWHQTVGTDGFDNLKEYVGAQQLEQVDVILPSWFTLSDNEGNMEYRGNGDYVTLAHENHLQVWAMLDNVNIPVDTLAILSDTKIRFRIEENLISNALLLGVDGINVDLEAITEQMATHYIQFLRELSILCRREGLVLSVDNPMPQAWNAYYKMGVQAEFVDYVILMGYDEHWSGGEPGSTASYNFVKSGIELALLEVPKERLINGIPWYTRVWSCENEENYAIGMNELASRLSSGEMTDLEVTWLEEEQQNYITFLENGKQYQVWAEDLQSMQWKLDLAQEYNLAGISCWKLGFETQQVWNMLSKWKSEN